MINDYMDLFYEMVACIAKQDRLTQMKNRAVTQLAILDLARELVADDDHGLIWEVGYGGGRTYDRLHRVFEYNPITVFDNRPDGKERVEGDGNVLHYGDVFSILPPIAAENVGAVRLVHADIGTPKFDRDLRTYATLGALVKPALAAGALVASDRPIAADDWTLLKSGLEYGWPYFLWQV
jgi:hypothetical protein